MVLPCYNLYFREVGAGVHVLHKNHDLFIAQAGETNGDGHISTVGQFLQVFFDVTVRVVLPWLLKICLGIDLLLNFNFSLRDAEVINDVTDGVIFVAHEVIFQFLDVLGAHGHDDDFDAHIKAGDFGPPLYPESI